MDELKKMIKLVINGQSLLRSEMLEKFKEIEIRSESLEERMKKGFKTVD